MDFQFIAHLLGEHHYIKGSKIDRLKENNLLINNQESLWRKILFFSFSLQEKIIRD